MAKSSILALVVSSSGTLQNGLLALMTTIPQINTVLVAEDIESALRIVENHHPSLILLDNSSPQGQEVIELIKTQWPQLHLLVLVDDVAQGKETEKSGADTTLLKGFSAQKFIKIVEDLVDRRVSTPTQGDTQGGTKTGGR